MAQAQGKIVQCIGAVVDVEFPRDQMPRVYDALKMEGSPLTLEVQQQLGDGNRQHHRQDHIDHGLAEELGDQVAADLGVDQGAVAGDAHNGLGLHRLGGAPM